MKQLTNQNDTPLDNLRDGLGVLGIALLLGMVAAIVASIPELVRYMKMKSM
ncbi:MAG: DUF6893 family small protein [Thermomicrobiales bacterium]